MFAINASIDFLAKLFEEPAYSWAGAYYTVVGKVLNFPLTTVQSTYGLGQFEDWNYQTQYHNLEFIGILTGFACYYIVPLAVVFFVTGKSWIKTILIPAGLIAGPALVVLLVQGFVSSVQWLFATA